jgi:prolipoprotein diacylglyceryl transferase
MVLALAMHIPSPPSNGFHLGPLFIHFYGLMYVIGIALAIIITRRRWQTAGGDPALVTDVATWAVPAGIVGGRIYFDITTPFDITPHAWWGVFAVWNGGLGIWGGIAAGVAVGIWRVHRAGADWRVMCDAVAPALLVAQAIGRIGNYFNQELFGKPTSLPWGLAISQSAKVNSGMPSQYLKYSYFQPSFLYELIWDLALAAFLVWLGHHRRIKPPGLLALYVAGYAGYRIFEETIRIDSSAHFLGLRLNMYIAIAVTLAGIGWFLFTQRRGAPEPVAQAASPGSEASTDGEDDAAATGEPGHGAATEEPGDTPTADGPGDAGADAGEGSDDSGNHAKVTATAAETDAPAAS